MSGLNAIVCEAVQQLTPMRKVGVLLNTALALIEDGQCGEEVERYLNFYLRTPGVPKGDMAKALLARDTNARKIDGEQVFAKAQVLDPVVWIQSPCKEAGFSNDPARQRVPTELWEQIAAHIPRHHLRTWLFVSHFHRNIASRYIFHTVNIYFGGDKEDQDDVHRGLDILSHAINDPIFASRVKSLRLHWEFEEAWHRIGNLVNTIVRIVEMSLPAFKGLRDFEWIGYPPIGHQNLRVDMVQALLDTHKNLHGLGNIVSYFSVAGISAFENLRKFSLHMGEPGGEDVNGVRTVLDRNKSTLKHLKIGGYDRLELLESGTINNLGQLDLVDMIVSNSTLTRIVHANNLRGFSLCGSFVDADSASAVFGSDRIINGSHSILPHLEEFRLDLEGSSQAPLYHSVIHFLRKRDKIRRLNLGSCPWSVIQDILPNLENLRVLGVLIRYLSQRAIKLLIESIPKHMVAIKLSVELPDEPLNKYARWFTRFNLNNLSFLHLRQYDHPSNAGYMSQTAQTAFRRQIGECLRDIATTVPSLDFVAWNDELCVVQVSHDDVGHRSDVKIKEIPTRRGMEYGWSSGVNIGKDAAWLEWKDVSRW